MNQNPARTILVIDDEDQIRAMLRRILEKNGYQVFEASDGAEGIKCCRTRHVHLIITDIFMPGKEGIETIIELRRDFPEIKIFAMSGGGSVGPETFLKITSQLGVLETFTKPIEREKLMSAIETLFSKS
ncbi:MAG: response regulator [Proteobacteria bacterium]|nr:response regulator [Pseudomonadota bacterium]